MNGSSGVIKIAALAAGGYLLYRYMSTAAAPATTTPAPGTPAPPTPPTPGPTVVTENNLKRAASWKAWAGEAGGKTLNWHQWNFYRAAFSSELAIPAPEDVGQGDGSALITATKYHDILGAAGLAGIAMRLARR
jgi:hypothetical protein